MRWAFVMLSGALSLACGSSTGGSAAQAGSAGESEAGASGSGGVAGAMASGGTSGRAGSSSGGTSNGGTSNGGTSSGGSAGASVVSGTQAISALGLNDRCLPDTLVLPLVKGETTCRVILTGVTGGCAAPGLSAPSAQDLASVMAAAQASGETTVEQSICQLARSDGRSGGECLAEAGTAWCYADGPCTNDQRACKHALCTTPGFNQMFFDQAMMPTYQLPAWLVCD